ncbi:hypothetical protein C4N9_03855 [Pararhodobacter marinus]|uniref:Sulfotransferase n=1 Tax=Pararhodobacter marinus TaxID=2184063 RepID=A0A2U2CG74_9RHOB|nr:sulfotransferase [Pararhodobacter marinus]PWE30897.1 hypothetical protein C4N9_03855 [Pararhodobacter marinus]
MSQSAASNDAPTTARLPDGVSLFLCIGAQKAGTSWLHDVLRHHSMTRTGPMKELHYFDGLYGPSQIGDKMRRRRLATLDAKGKAGEAARVRRLQQAVDQHDLTHQGYVDVVSKGLKPGQVAIDTTPAYAFLPGEAFRAMAGLGDTRFLFILREPVARFWSSVRMRVDDARGPKAGPKAADIAARDLSFEEACRRLLDTWIEVPAGGHWQRSDYARTLDCLTASVPAERRKVIFFETLFQRDTVDGIQDFLGLHREELDLLDARNVGQDATMRPDQIARLTELLRPQYDAVCKAMGEAAVPGKWHARFASTPASA